MTPTHKEGYHGNEGEVHQEVAEVEDHANSAIFAQIFDQMFHIISIISILRDQL